MVRQLSAFGRLDRPASAVLFAGMGGACEGIRLATGVSPLVAVNHCEHALRVHARNHSDVIHLREDVFGVVPSVAARGRKIGLLWLSPDCTHHSRARGGRPRESGRRSLADVAIPWAEQVRPWIIMLENVPEWLSWGPLDDDGHPIKDLAGSLFRGWVAKLEALGYRVEWRILVAADYGAPTSRKRLYLIARCDGKPIVWPAPTHGPGRAIPWHTAAECIDWSIPGRSIFGRKNPLADATMRRIAHGLVRYVLECPRPYIVQTGHQSSDSGKVRPSDEPLSTVVTKAEHLLLAPHLTKFYGTAAGSPLNEPTPTVTATGQHLGLVSAHLIHHRGESVGRGLDEPAPTVTATGQGHLGLVSAWLAKHYTGATGSSLYESMSTITAIDHNSLCEVRLSQTETAGARQVAAFLVKYYGTGVGQSLRTPLDTVTVVDRFGLVTVSVEGEPYVVTDIHMRMLQPRELARAMGFEDSYILEGTKEQQVARVGNAVCPPVAEALVRANMECHCHD